MAKAGKANWGRRLMVTGGGLVGLGVLGWLLTWPEVPPAVANSLPEARPAVLPPAKNAFTIYLAGGEAVRLPRQVGGLKDRAAKGHLMSGIDEWKPELRPTIAAFVRDNGPALAKLHQGRSVPDMQVSPPGHTLQTKLPSYIKVQDLMRLGKADMVLAWEAGRHEAAFQRALDLLSLGRRMSYAYEDVLITELVGAVICDRTLAALKTQSATVAKAPTPALEAFLRGLNALDGVERPIEQFLLGERDNSIRSAPLMQPGERLGLPGIIALFPVADKYATFSRNILDLQMERVAARDWKGQRAILEKYIKMGPRETASMLFHPADGAVRVIGSIALPSSHGAAEKLLRNEARFDALRIRVAADLFRRAHGRAPVKLDELKATGLRGVPVDPFKPQQPLQFAGGRLWSVGWDGIDQQGKVVQPEKHVKETAGDLLL